MSEDGRDIEDIVTTLQEQMKTIQQELSRIRGKKQVVESEEPSTGERIGEQIKSLQEKFAKRISEIIARISEEDSINLECVQDVPAEDIAGMMSPLGNEDRMKVLGALDQGPKNFLELEEVTGRKGGTMKYHLNQLEDAGYLTQEKIRGRYFLTIEGRLAYKLSTWFTKWIMGREENDESGPE